MDAVSEINPQLKLAFDFVQFTNSNIFLTGKAGTGKTTFLHDLRKISPKRMIVVAPTGVAAINAGGVTIHSFFQMHFGPHIPENEISGDSYEPAMVKQRTENVQKFNRDKINIMRSLDLLIIDEISMVRADLLDGIDEVLRRYRDHYKPFGGVQLLLIGDLQQLAPVAKDEEWDLLRRYYGTVFFFSSKALQRTELVTIELKHIFRQSDRHFIDLLNKVRNNQIDTDTLIELNKRYIPGFEHHATDGYITLTTHNYQSQQINEVRLNNLDEEEQAFTAQVEGVFPEYSYPADYNLVVKKGAQVMFVKNDLSRDKLYYNGKIGKIVNITYDTIYVKCPGDYATIPVQAVEWQNFKYTIDEITKEIKETVEGTFTQVPLKLAWAITIHKSQGLTFEKAIIDANAAFAHGQVYVALSRCKTFEGLVLSSRIAVSSVKSDGSVKEFSRQVEANQPDQEKLFKARVLYQRQMLAELIDFSVLKRRIAYCLKIVREHAAAMPETFLQNILQIEGRFTNEIVSIAEKFRAQVTQLLELADTVEENSQLQERIHKAAGYFLEKLVIILQNELDQMEIETDNKTVRKSLRDAFHNLAEETRIKIAVFEACKEGFFIKKYIESKAKASVEKPAKQETGKTDGKISTVKTRHPELYKMLKEWRNEKADELGCPLNMVIPQKAMKEVSEDLPLTESALKKVHGVGKQTVRKFGEAILDVVKRYYRTISKDAFTEAEEQHDQIPESRKLKSVEVSLELFREGKTIAEIARERSLTVGTIESHLSQFVSSGELDVKQLLAPDKLEKALDWFEENPGAFLSDARNILGDEFSYGELRFVQRHMERKAINN
jgi:hypothetical protein